MDLEKVTDENLAPLVEFANLERGNKRLIAAEIQKSAPTVSRQMVESWLHGDPDKRRYPSLKYFFALEGAVKTLRK